MGSDGICNIPPISLSNRPTCVCWFRFVSLYELIYGIEVVVNLALSSNLTRVLKLHVMIGSIIAGSLCSIVGLQCCPVRQLNCYLTVLVIVADFEISLNALLLLLIL